MNVAPEIHQQVQIENAQMREKLCKSERKCVIKDTQISALLKTHEIGAKLDALITVHGTEPKKTLAERIRARDLIQATKQAICNLAESAYHEVAEKLREVYRCAIAIKDFVIDNPIEAMGGVAIVAGIACVAVQIFILSSLVVGGALTGEAAVAAGAGAIVFDFTNLIY